MPPVMLSPPAPLRVLKQTTVSSIPPLVLTAVTEAVILLLTTAKSLKLPFST